MQLVLAMRWVYLHQRAFRRLLMRVPLRVCLLNNIASSRSGGGVSASPDGRGRPSPSRRGPLLLRSISSRTSPSFFGAAAAVELTIISARLVLGLLFGQPD